MLRSLAYANSPTYAVELLRNGLLGVDEDPISPSTVTVILLCTASAAVVIVFIDCSTAAQNSAIMTSDSRPDVDNADEMTAIPLHTPRNDDPLVMRELLQRAAGMVERHSISCMMVGLAANEGDLLFPEVVDFIESALRVDDAIYRMTRERAVLFLTDVERVAAEEIVGRNLLGFRERFATASELAISLGFFEMGPRTLEATVKDVLPQLFSPTPGAH